MRIYAVIVYFLAASMLSVQGQSAPEQAAVQQPNSQQKMAQDRSAGQSKIDPAKEADIRKLLEITGTKAVVTQSMDQMAQNIKPVLAHSLPPGDYRDKLIDLFFEKFLSRADAQHMLDLAVPIYDKYFTHEDITGLIQFYGTPLGRKTVSFLPQAMSELMQAGQKWGEQLGRDSMVEVLSEHPDLAKALEAAGKGDQP